jgi:DNA primase
VGEWHGVGMLAGCVAVRLHDPSGEPLGYAGRRRDPDEAARPGKWSFPRALPKVRLLYGLHRVRGERVVLTECPWGVLRLAQLGVHAVAVLGVAMSTQQRALLASFREVLVLMDGDHAGRAAAVTVVRDLGNRAHLVDLPDGADPDDLTDAALATVANQRAPPTPVTDGYQLR